jgi:hypothetical protein
MKNSEPILSHKLLPRQRALNLIFTPIRNQSAPKPDDHDSVRGDIVRIKCIHLSQSVGSDRRSSDQVMPFHMHCLGTPADSTKELEQRRAPLQHSRRWRRTVYGVIGEALARRTSVISIPTLGNYRHDVLEIFARRSGDRHTTADCLRTYEEARRQ